MHGKENMFKPKKQEPQNELHTEYGILSNSVYI